MIEQSRAEYFKALSAFATAIARRWNPGEVKSFAVLRVSMDSGQIKELRVERSHGVLMFDQSAINSVRSTAKEEHLLKNGDVVFTFDSMWHEPELRFRPAAEGSSLPNHPSYRVDGMPDLIPYQIWLKKRIASNWQGRSKTAQAIVTMTVMKDGSSSQPKIVVSSGSDEFDAEALHSLTALGYYPLPDPGPSKVHFTIWFGWGVDIQKAEAQF